MVKDEWLEGCVEAEVQEGGAGWVYLPPTLPRYLHALHDLRCLSGS